MFPNLPPSLTILAKKFCTYENWINSGFPAPIPNNIPREYMDLLKRDPLSYFLYRGALVELFAKHSGSSDLFSDMKKLIETLNRKDKTKCKEILNSDATRYFQEEWANVFEAFHLISKDGISQAACLFYHHKYEVDAPLIILAIAIRFITSNTLDFNLDDLKDKSGRLLKGKTLHYLRDNMSAFPHIKQAVETAYNTKLRNLIGHNKYRLSKDAITSLDGKVFLNQKDFMAALFALQEYQNAFIWAGTTNFSMEELEKVKDSGFAAIAYEIGEGGTILQIHLFQLWCFYNIDPAKNWLNSVSFKAEQGKLRARFSDTVYFDGDSNDISAMAYADINRKEFISVRVISVMPFTGDETREIKLKWGKFQTTDDICEKRVRIVNSHNHPPQA